MCALLAGSYLFGSLSDLIGRKKALTIAALVNGVGLLMTAFMPNYILFTIARFITGLGMRTKQSFSDKKIKKNYKYVCRYVE